MNNLLTAIRTIIENSFNAVESSKTSTLNRANQMGDALEDYVKDAFADCIGRNQKDKNLSHSKVFSYLGNSTNPPDAMLKGGGRNRNKEIDISA